MIVFTSSEPPIRAAPFTREVGRGSTKQRDHGEEESRQGAANDVSPVRSWIWTDALLDDHLPGVTWIPSAKEVSLYIAGVRGGSGALSNGWILPAPAPSPVCGGSLAEVRGIRSWRRDRTRSCSTL